MRAANTISAERLEFEERPLPPVTPGSALVRIEHVTLCGTDLHIWEGEYLNPFPIVQGHECVGRVEALATGEDRVTIGDRVVISPVRSCGDCHACRAGRANVCSDVSVLGCYEDGVLAEFVVAPVESLRLVPPGVPSELAPLSEPTSIALQAVRRGRPEPGELALVIGSGPIGLIATLGLRELGVDVVAADTVAERARTAQDFGAVASIVIGADGFPPTADIARLAGGDTHRPITLVIEATGAPAAFEAALNLASPTARVVAVGISDRDTTIPMRTIPLKELDVIGSRNSLDLISQALVLIAQHRDKFMSLITHRYRFDDVEAALKVLRTDAANVRKVLISIPSPYADASGIAR